MGSPPLVPPGQPTPLQPGEWIGAGVSAIVGFKSKLVEPPSRVYVGLDDKIIVSVVSSAASVALQVNSRLLRPDNVIVPITYTVPLGVAGTTVTQSFSAAEGFLLSATPALTAALGVGKWCYCTIGLRRGTGTTLGTYEILFAGYVGGNFLRGYPEALLIAPGEGNGTVRTVVITPPAAGTEWTATVPPYATWRINSAEAILHTSADVANRIAGIGIWDGASEFWGQLGTQPVPASGFMVMEIAASGKNGGASPNFTEWLPIPANMLLGPNSQIYSSTTGLQAADVWTQIVLNVTEWLALL